MKQQKPLLRRLALWLPAVAWYLLIFYFSSQTGTESSQVSDGVLTDIFRLDLSATSWELFLLLSFLVRKAAHAFIFFVLTGLLLLPLRELIQDRKKLYLAAVGLCALLAGLDEFHQLFVPGRDGKLPDVLLDTAGGACFLLFLALVRFFSGKLKKRKEALAEK